MRLQCSELHRIYLYIYLHIYNVHTHTLNSLMNTDVNRCIYLNLFTSSLVLILEHWEYDEDGEDDKCLVVKISSHKCDHDGDHRYQHTSSHLGVMCCQWQ